MEKKTPIFHRNAEPKSYPFLWNQSNLFMQTNNIPKPLLIMPLFSFPPLPTFHCFPSLYKLTTLFLPHTQTSTQILRWRRCATPTGWVITSPPVPGGFWLNWWQQPRRRQRGSRHVWGLREVVGLRRCVCAHPPPIRVRSGVGFTIESISGSIGWGLSLVSIMNVCM